MQLRFSKSVLLIERNNLCKKEDMACYYFYRFENSFPELKYIYVYMSAI